MAEDLMPLSPSLRRWELGGTLRKIREGQHKTIEQVARDLSELYGTGFSAAKIGRLETGRRGANPRDVRDLCDYYELDPAERDRLVAMAKDARRDNRLRSMDTAYAEFVALESIASTVRVYEPMFVPGLLQTSDYYSAVCDSELTAGMAPGYFTDDWIQTSTEIRRTRKLRLDGENALQCHVILDENVIRRRVGSAEVMAAQLAHLIETSRKPNVSLRIVPLLQGVYPGCESAGFTLLEYAPGEHLRDNVCYVEGFVTSMLAERAAHRERIAGIFAYLQKIALGVEESRAIIHGAIEGHRLSM